MSVSIPAPIAEFLKQPLFAAIATTGDHGPQLTWVWYEFDGQRFLVSTTDDRVKYRNVQRDPRVAISVNDPANPYRYVAFNCKVTLTRDGASDLIHQLAIRYQGQEKGDTAGQSMRGPKRVILVLEPESMSTYNF